MTKQNAGVKMSPRGVVISNIRKEIDSGVLLEGCPLPSEQSLADRFNVARTTVRAALQDLENSNVIHQDGRRRIVCEKVRPAGNSFLSDSIVVLDDNVYSEGTSMPGLSAAGFDVQIFQAIRDAAQENNRHILLVSPGKVADGKLRQLMEESPAGVIMLHLNASSHERAKSLIQLMNSSKTLCSCYAVDNSDLYTELPTVTSDHRQGSYLLTKWMIEHGRKTILRYWRLASREKVRPPWLKARDQGYEDAMREAGLPILPAIEYYEENIEDKKDKVLFDNKVYQCMGRLHEVLEKRVEPDAVLCLSDGVAFSVAAALRKLGKSPNKDVLIAGYDNYASNCSDSAWENCGPIVTMDKDNIEIGKALVNLVEQKGSTQNSEGVPHIVLPPTLVELG